MKKTVGIPRDAKKDFFCKNVVFELKVRKKKGRVFHNIHNHSCGKLRNFLP